MERKEGSLTYTGDCVGLKAMPYRSETEREKNSKLKSDFFLSLGGLKKIIQTIIKFTSIQNDPTSTKKTGAQKKSYD